VIGTGKYDFPGIRKAAAAGVNLLLAGTSWGAWLIASPFKGVIQYLLEWVLEYFANKGLVLINIGAFYVEGKFEQSAFDTAMNDGLEKAKVPGLSDAKKKAIDDEVKKAFRKFGRINTHDGMSDVSDE
jgi:hypothetical protein